MQQMKRPYPGQARRCEAGRGLVALRQEVEPGRDGEEDPEGGGPEPVHAGLVLVSESGPVMMTDVDESE